MKPAYRTFIVALGLLALVYINAPHLLPNIGGLLHQSPVPGEGLHVLIVEDVAKRPELSEPQKSAIFSAEINKLIRDHKGERHQYDYTADVTETKNDWLIKAKALPMERYPWVVIDNDGRGVSQALPDNQADFKALIESYLK